MTISQAIIKYNERREKELSYTARRQFAVVLGWLVEYCERQGKSQLSDLTVDLLESFKIEGMPAILLDSSRSTYTAKLRAFISECERLGWISSRLADRIRPHRHEHEQTQPFSDSDVNMILANADPIHACLFDLMLETGLRVSDAIQYNPLKLIRGEQGLWVYSYQMTKHKRFTACPFYEVFITHKLKEWIELNRSEWRSIDLPFRSKHSLHADYVRIYNKMQSIGKAAGISDCRPHRLRDTFAVRCLLKGMSVDDVSRLLGHSSVTMTERAYAAWVPARTRRLEKIVAQSLE